MLLGNIPDGYLFNLLPPVVQSVDVRQLISCVLGGFQDRMGDLRYYSDNIGNLMDPWSTAVPLPASGYTGPRTILCTYVPQSQVPVTISLLDDGTAPPDGPALLTWCTGQLQLDPSVSQVTAAVTGSDVLRTLTVNQIQLLADSLGATLYPGLLNELPAQTAARQAQIVQSYFPRLQIKGTTTSFAAMARLSGYDSAALIPLWGRLSPRSTDLTVASVGDFNAYADYYPTASLPDLFYNPASLRDGPWFSYQSGSLYPSQSSSAYYTSINGQNPFITIIPQGTATGVIQAGTYTLSGGMAQVYATAPFNSGYYSANLEAQAIAPGETFNGLSVIVTNAGSWQQISILDQLSTVKFRSSYYDANVALTVANAGTTLVQSNPSLQNGLVVSDGSSVAPWRPWGGGVGPTYNVTTWPNTSVVLNASVGTVARTQVPISAVQLDMIDLTAGAHRVLALAQEDCIPATRLPRHMGAGPLWQDSTSFAPWLNTFNVPYSTGTNVSTSGSNFGSVFNTFLPSGSLVAWYLNGLLASSETVGTQVMLDSPFITGSFNLVNSTYTLWAKPAATGILSLGYTKSDLTLTNPEPTFAMKVGGSYAGQSYPAGTYVPPSSNVALSGSATLGQSSTLRGASGAPTLTYMTTEDIPWQRLNILAGGDKTSANAFVPVQGDPNPIFTGVEMDWLDQGNTPYWLRIRDTPGAMTPYAVKAIPSTTAGPINMAFGSFTGTNYNAGTRSSLMVPMRVVGNLPIAQDALLPARTDNLAWWWPLVENQNEHLVVKEAMTQTMVPLLHALPTDRVYNTPYGWQLTTWSGVATSPALSLGNPYALGLRIQTSSTYNPYAFVQNYSVPVIPGNTAYAPYMMGSPIATVGQLSVVLAGTASAFASFAVTVGTTYNSTGTAYNVGSVYNTGTVTLLAGGYNYVYASYNAGTVNLRVRQDGSGGFSGSSVSVGSPVVTSPYVTIQAGNPLTGMQDLCVWSGGTKTDAQLTVVANPNFTATAAATSLPFSYSLRGDRYSFTVLNQGFGVPGPVNPNTFNTFEDATVIRYAGDGSYNADPRFKRVGLGENQPLPTVWRLGMQAAQPIMAIGQAVMAGTQTPLPAWTASFKGTAGSIDWQGPSPTGGYGPTGGTVSTTYQTGGSLWQQDMNTVVDRMYLVGSDGSAYDTYVDNLGYGPLLLSSVVVRNNSYPQQGVITADCPTDRMVSLYSGGTIAVAQYGTVASIPSTGTTGYPYDLNMYSDSQLVASVTNPLSILSNPTPFALQNNVPALSSAGDMTFVMNQYAGGPAPLFLDFLVGNIGQLDPDFDGFFVTVTVEAPNMPPVSVPAVLLPNATGLNPQGWQTVSVPITTSLSGFWRISIDWTNSRTVPNRGWSRQLAIYQFTARSAITSMVHVQTNPLSVTPVSVYSPAGSVAAGLQAGAWVAHVTNSGTVYPATHESLAYSPIIDNAFNWAVNPAANTLTGSTASRFSDFRSVTTYSLANQRPPSAPVINSMTFSPSGFKFLYNVGQQVNFTANVTASNPRYVWNMWNTGTLGTINPVYSASFTAGGTVIGSLTVVDSIGQTSSWAGSFMVNNPPTIYAAQAFPNDQVVPYTTSLQAYVSPGNNPYTGAVNPYQTYWLSPAGSVFATGTLVNNYPVTASQTVTAVAYDNLGGTTTVPLYIAAENPNPPVISIADFNSVGYVNTNYGVGNVAPMQFAAMGYDPQNELLTPVWSFWTGGTTPGNVQALTNFGNGSLFTATLSPYVTSPSYYSFGVTVTNTSNLSATANASVNFLVNEPPVITSAYVAGGAAQSAVIAGQPVQFAATAVDPDNNVLNFSWNITPGNVTLLGPNVTFNTTGLAVGTVITATVTVSDSFGLSVSQTLPGVTVASQGLSNCVIHPPSQTLSGGVNVVITPPVNMTVGVGNVQYTVNGASPLAPNAASTTYTGPFQISGYSGQTFIVQVAAFQSGYAPSLVATSVYTCQ